MFDYVQTLPRRVHKKQVTLGASESKTKRPRGQEARLGRSKVEVPLETLAPCECALSHANVGSIKNKVKSEKLSQSEEEGEKE